MVRAFCMCVCARVEMTKPKCRSTVEVEFGKHAKQTYYLHLPLGRRQHRNCVILSRLNS